MHCIQKFEKKLDFRQDFLHFLHHHLQIHTYFLQNFKNKEKCCPLLTTVVSGSPIIQNGKLIGAVTHVFVNDPTRGYGIFIENMLAEAERIK